MNTQSTTNSSSDHGISSVGFKDAANSQNSKRVTLLPLPQVLQEVDISEPLKRVASLPPPPLPPVLQQVDISDPLKRAHHDRKVVRLSDVLENQLEGSEKVYNENYKGKDIPLEVEEEYDQLKAKPHPIVLVIIKYYTALKIFLFYLISLNALITVGLSVGLTFYWYDLLLNDTSGASGSMSWVLLGFAVITPLSMSLGMAFRRREQALHEVAKFRSFAYQLFLAHAIWDWKKAPNGRAGSAIDWVQHADIVLGELISIGDELCRFLSLPSMTTERHRMTQGGRREAARTAEVAYKLYNSFYTRRFIRLSMLSEKLKLEGLGASEGSRIRQYERWMGDAIEELRMIKSYRTPQTLRSFSRIFTTLLPPFFAPAFAQLAINSGSLSIGMIFAVITGLCLNALLAGVEILEDPFVAFVTLDGVDVREEFQVLHYQQLVNARNEIFPDAKPYEYREKGVTEDVLDGDIESGHAGSIESTSQESCKRKAFAASKRSVKEGGYHRTLINLGDAKFLSGHEDDVKKGRKSAYELLRGGYRKTKPS